MTKRTPKAHTENSEPLANDPEDSFEGRGQDLQDQEDLDACRLPSDRDPLSPPYDPIENAMRRHPGLTREEAEKLAEAAGF